MGAASCQVVSKGCFEGVTNSGACGRIRGEFQAGAKVLGLLWFEDYDGDNNDE